MYFQFLLLKFEEEPDRAYLNNLRNASFLTTTVTILMLQMIELRIKHLSLPYLLALSFHLTLVIHLPELVGVIAEHPHPIKIGYAVLHKGIEIIPLTAYSSSLLLNGTKRCSSVLMLIALILSIYISRFFNEFEFSFFKSAPVLVYITIFIFPYALSTRILNHLINPTFKDSLN